MSATTTLKLPDDLKARIAPLAAAAGVSAHAWMVGALGTQVILAEQRQSFVRDALAAADEVDGGGEVFAARTSTITCARSWPVEPRSARRPRLGDGTSLCGTGARRPRKAG